MTLDTSKTTGDYLSDSEWTELATAANKVTDNTLAASNISDFDTEVANNTAVSANTSKISFDSTSSSKLAGIEAGAEVNNISDANVTDLTDSGDSTLHYHANDRNRTNHTGTQSYTTISDLGEAVADIVGAMVTSNTETNITVTYDDADNTLDFVVATASSTASGVVELATTTETTTGTDATRAVTPDGLHDMTSLAGAAWFLDEDAMTTNSATKVASQQSIKAYADTKMANLAEDTTPQLGGTLDINGKSITGVFTAGEALVAGNICYLKSDGKYWKVDADAEATSKGNLAMALASISASATGVFMIYGFWTTTGLTAGATYYLSTTAGAMTTTAPSGSLDIVRIAGYAPSTTIFLFNPDHTYIEVA